MNTERYSNRAIKELREKNIETFAIGLKNGAVLDVKVEDEKKQFKDIDTVTLYLNPIRQKEYYDYVISLKPRRVIFNPGTENPEFLEILKKNNIETEVVCTLVLLSINQY